MVASPARASLVELGTGCATDADSPDHLAVHAYGQSTAENEDRRVHVPETLDLGPRSDQLGELPGRSAQARGRVGLAPAAVDGVRSRAVRSREHLQYATPVDDGDAHSVALIPALRKRRKSGLGGELNAGQQCRDNVLVEPVMSVDLLVIWVQVSL